MPAEPTSEFWIEGEPTGALVGLYLRARPSSAMRPTDGPECLWVTGSGECLARWPGAEPKWISRTLFLARPDSILRPGIEDVLLDELEQRKRMTLS